MNHKILIADDHSIVRSGLKYLIKEMLPFSLCEEARNGDEVFTHTKRNKFDLLILDINMPYTDSFTLINNLLAHDSTLKILIFTMNAESIYAERLFKLGVLGFLHKEVNSNFEIMNAINTVLNNKVYLNKDSKLLATKNISLSTEEKSPFEKLTNREFQIAQSIINGDTQAQIIETFKLHPSTISTHKANIFEKLGIESIQDLLELHKMYN